MLEDLLNHGNVLVATSFLQGLATNKLSADDLDDDYQAVKTVVAAT